VNFSLSIKIPLSFIKMPLKMIVNVDDILFKEKKTILEHFKTHFSPVGYEKKASDLTNHTEVVWNVYTIETYGELNFFKKFNSYFKCGADFLFEKEFETFLIQNDINIGMSVRSLTPIFKNSCRQFLKFKSYDLINNSKIFYIDLTFDESIKSNKNYLAHCKEFWQLTMCPDDCNVKVFNKVACFDIECGLANCEQYENTDSDKLPFPTFSIGYVQCIVIYSIYLSNEYIENSPSITLLSLCPKRIIQNINQKINFINKLSKSFEKYNITMEDIKIELFTSELDLIRHFFSLTFQIDYLIGFNSKSFDLAYLILRANILSSEKWFTNKYINSYCLTKISFGDQLSTKTAQTINLATKCSKCATKIYVSDKNTFQSDKKYIVTCSCQNTCMLTNDSIEFEQKSSYFYVQELPFTYHHDLLLKEQLYANTKNRKLETVTNFNFRQKISNICIDERNSLRAKIFLNDEYSYDELFIIGNIFCMNIKLVIFKLHKNSFHMIDEIECRLSNVIFLDSNNMDLSIDGSNYNYKKLHILKKELEIRNGAKKFKLLFEIDCFNNAILNIKDFEDMFVSVGKTSDQTRYNQLIWKTEQNIIDTCTYCLIDVLLTFSLELKFHTLYDIFSSVFFRICPFNVLCWTSARKSTFLSINMRNKISVDVLFNNFTIQKILNHSLEVEGVRDDLYLNSNELEHNTYKLTALQNLDEYLNLDTNTINSNEYEFGTLGQDDPSDLNVVKSTINCLINNIKIDKKVKG
jgi:hypothetical protein